MNIQSLKKKNQVYNETTGKLMFEKTQFQGVLILNG